MTGPDGVNPTNTGGPLFNASEGTVEYTPEAPGFDTPTENIDGVRIEGRLLSETPQTTTTAGGANATTLTEEQRQEIADQVDALSREQALDQLSPEVRMAFENNATFLSTLVVANDETIV